MNITIYGKQNCAECHAAKAFLDSKSIPYEYRELDVDFVREDLQLIAPNARSYPVILVNEHPVNGMTGLWNAIVLENMTPESKQYLAE